MVTLLIKVFMYKARGGRYEQNLISQYEKLYITILIFFITDTDYLYVYVPDNRYAEPIFIYCYKVNK